MKSHITDVSLSENNHLLFIIISPGIRTREKNVALTLIKISYLLKKKKIISIKSRGKRFKPQFLQSLDFFAVRDAIEITVLAKTVGEYNSLHVRRVSHFYVEINNENNCASWPIPQHFTSLSTKRIEPVCP